MGELCSRVEGWRRCRRDEGLSVGLRRVAVSLPHLGDTDKKHSEHSWDTVILILCVYVHSSFVSLSFCPFLCLCLLCLLSLSLSSLSLSMYFFSFLFSFLVCCRVHVLAGERERERDNEQSPLPSPGAFPLPPASGSGTLTMSSTIWDPAAFNIHTLYISCLSLSILFLKLCTFSCLPFFCSPASFLCLRVVYVPLLLRAGTWLLSLLPAIVRFRLFRLLAF